MPGFFRVLGLVLAGVVLLLGGTWAAVYGLSENRLTQRVEVPRETIPIPNDIGSLQRGQHLASAVAACADCHGTNLSGKVVVDARTVGRIVAPNLTRGRGGVGSSLSDADVARAIRHGVGRDGRLLLSMPSDTYNHFSDADLGAIIAYVRAIPAIDTSLPSSQISPLGRLLFVGGQLRLQPGMAIDHFAARPVPPRAGVTPAYGQYLVESAGCPTCHGPGLSGGTVTQAAASRVNAANLTPAGLGVWSDTDFIRAMRTGMRPDGRTLNTLMPWPYYAQLTDDELRAIWRFLQALPAGPTGGR